MCTFKHFFVIRKPHARRVVQKRLTGEEDKKLLFDTLSGTASHANEIKKEEVDQNEFGRHKQFKPYTMELQISHSLCTKVQAESVLPREENRSGKNIEATM